MILLPFNIGLNRENLTIEMYDLKGILVQKTTLNAGATNTYLDTKTIYEGNYIVKILGAHSSVVKQVSVVK
jgi:hypothetical protein